MRELGARANGAVILRDIGFGIAPGEILALFGPSGAGKTTIATALAGTAGPGIELSGAIHRAPGVRVGYLPQHAASTLNPARRIGAALGELVALHTRRAAGGRLRAGERRARIARVLAAAAFELDDRDLTRALRRYPFEFSGGERARLALAQVLTGAPDVLVVDEPTVGLDSLARATLLDGLRGLRAAGTAVVLITHDSFAVERVADRILFVRDGRLDPAGSIESAPAHPRPVATPAVTGPAVEIRDLTVRHRGRPVLDRVDLDLYPGEHIGLVGLSGAGKTTLARCIAGLTRPDAGEIVAWGERLPELRRRSRRRLADIQYVWQESAASFDPRRSVLDQVAATGTGLCGMTHTEARAAATDLLAGLGIDEAQAARPPAGLSGGQLQRAALARALLARPRVLLCDEVTTALDEPTARRILDRLDDYREHNGATLVSISHDLRGRLDRCDRIAVLDGARITEIGAPAELRERPRTEILARLVCADGADLGDRFSQHQLERNR
ncbi:ABC transporter ATP-binding protein [Nocardia jinanensis]|uniref:ABC transporter ATP-binding protein n=1 Tax=Nocardia jinanensis TaxID=382504 RepID=A0A917R5X5_9NOCA|nr:ABC transporter ATP-binding protein [Nocardia jinanensis]